MKKKVLAGIMMAVMMMASVMGVSAAGSKTNEVSLSGNSKEVYEISVGDASLKTGAEAVMTSGKRIITSSPVWNVTAKDDAAQNANGKYEVELTVTALTSSCSNVEVLSYADGAWAKARVISVKDNVVVVELAQMPATIAICANVTTSGSTGTSPSTVGTSSAWMLWAAVAIVALGAGVVATQKKSR